MLPPDFFSIETLEYALGGAALGVAASLLNYCWRDRDYLFHRWRAIRAKARGEPPIEEYIEPVGYGASPVTANERKALPKVTARLGAIGAVALTAYELQIEHIDLYVYGAIAVIGIMAALVSDDAEEVGVPADPTAPPDPKPSRWEKIKRNLLELAFLAPLLLIFTVEKGGLGDFRLPVSLLSNFFWSVAFIASLGFWIYRQRKGPPDHLEFEELQEWNRETAIALIAAITIGMIGLIFWLG